MFFARMADRGIPAFSTERREVCGCWDRPAISKYPRLCGFIRSVCKSPSARYEVFGLRRDLLSQPRAPDSRFRRANFRRRRVDFTLRWLIDLLGNYCPVLDPEANILKGRNKFDQFAVAENVDSIPITLITNDSTAARDFVDRHKKVAIKSVADGGASSRRRILHLVYTNIVHNDILGRFDLIFDGSSPPSRVHRKATLSYESRLSVRGFSLVGLTRRAHHRRVDWRHYDDLTPHSIYATDKSLDDRLTAIMRHYGIRFGII